MTIKGISRRAAVLGHIKIGGRKKINTQNGERTIPVKFDHFVVTTNEQEELGYVIDDVLTRRLLNDQLRMMKDEATERIYENRIVDGEVRRVLIKTIQHTPDDVLEQQNDAVRRILVTLPFDDPDENLVTSLSVYDRNGCRCRGDNESADWIDPQTGEATKVACPCNMLKIRLSEDDDPDQRPQHEMAQHGMVPRESNGFTCKANGVLRVKIEQARTIGGVYLFRTTSMNSIRQLLDSMNSISAITGGTLAGYPLNLVVEPKRLRPRPNKPAHIGYVVNLIFKADEDAFLRYVIEKIAVREQLKAQLNAREIQQLPAPGYEPRQEQVAIAEEFYATGVPEDFMDGHYEERSLPPAREDPQQGKKEQDATTPSDAPVETQKAAEPLETPEESSDTQTDAPGETEQQTDAKPANPVEEEKAESAGEKDSQDAGADQKGNGEGGRQFPAVNREMPEGADTGPAPKDIRKKFFLKARAKGLQDNEIRTWIDELWQAKSSSALKTWQVESMMASLQ